MTASDDIVIQSAPTASLGRKELPATSSGARYLIPCHHDVAVRVRSHWWPLSTSSNGRTPIRITWS